MIELRLKRIADVQRMYTGDVILTVVCEKAQNETLDKLYQAKGKSLKEYIIRLFKPKKKRSLDANAYMWVLCDKVASKLGQTKEFVYRTAVKQVGVWTDVKVKPEAVKELVSGWEHNGTGWLTEPVDAVGEEKTVRLYYGSSTYDSKQMARLIDEVIGYCKDFEIEYLSPDELERMVAAWGEKTT